MDLTKYPLLDQVFEKNIQLFSPWHISQLQDVCTNMYGTIVPCIKVLRKSVIRDMVNNSNNYKMEMIGQEMSEQIPEFNQANHMAFIVNMALPEEDIFFIIDEKTETSALGGSIDGAIGLLFAPKLGHVHVNSITFFDGYIFIYSDDATYIYLPEYGNAVNGDIEAKINFSGQAVSGIFLVLSPYDNLIYVLLNGILYTQKSTGEAVIISLGLGFDLQWRNLCISEYDGSVYLASEANDENDVIVRYHPDSAVIASYVSTHQSITSGTTRKMLCDVEGNLFVLSDNLDTERNTQISTLYMLDQISSKWTVIKHRNMYDEGGISDFIISDDYVVIIDGSVLTIIRYK